MELIFGFSFGNYIISSVILFLILFVRIFVVGCKTLGNCSLCRFQDLFCLCTCRILIKSSVSGAKVLSYLLPHL